MSDSEVSGRMRDDWNARAREDAGYYVAFGRRDQTTRISSPPPPKSSTVWNRAAPRAAAAARQLESARNRLRPGPADAPHEPPFRRNPRRGCFRRDDRPGARAAARHSQRASPRDRRRDAARVPRRIVRFRLFLRRVPACPQPATSFTRYHAGNPPRAEDRRPGAAPVQRIARHGYPAGSDTWAGARFTSSEILEFTELHDFQLLALEGAGTQYMWTTWRKQPRGWQAEQGSAVSPIPVAHPPGHQLRQLGAGSAVARPFRFDLPVGRESSAGRRPAPFARSRWAIRWGRSPTSAPPMKDGLQASQRHAAGTGGHRLAARGIALAGAPMAPPGYAARDSSWSFRAAHSLGHRRREPGSRQTHRARRIVK